MKYIEVVDKQEALKVISDCINTMKKNHVPIPPEFPEIYYEISQLKTSGHFEMEDTDNKDYDPFYDLAKASEINICPLRDTIPC